MTTDRDDAEALAEVLDGVDDRMGKLDTSTRRYASAISSAFASAITSGRAFDDVLKSLALRLSAMSVSMAMRPLVSDLLGGFEGLFAGGSIKKPDYMPAPGGAPPTPAGAAPHAAAMASPVAITITTPDAESFRRSEAYVTGQIARAVARGQRTL